MPKARPATVRLRDLATIVTGKMPGQLVIQYSDACNATCPQCELRVTNRFGRARIPMDDMKRIIGAAAKNGVRAVSFTGGEPFLYQDSIIELLHACETAGIPYTRTGTNGFMFRGSDEPGWEKRIRELAEALAGTSIYTLWISIDSADAAVHEQMRGLPGVIRGIERAQPILAEYGIYPAANLGINRNVGGLWDEVAGRFAGPFDAGRFHDHFRRAFDRFYRFVANLGFISANACYPMSVQGADDQNIGNLYGASSPDEIVRFTAEEKGELFGALLETIPVHCGALRIFTPLASLYALTRRYRDGFETGYPCPGGSAYFFVDAQSGGTWPCGFRSSENLGRFWELDPAVLKRPHTCRRCDWECFRDPAELIGPGRELFRAPLKLLARYRRDPVFFRYWRRDIAYQKACRFFHCRMLPDYRNMARFVTSPAPVAGESTGTFCPPNPSVLPRRNNPRCPCGHGIPGPLPHAGHRHRGTLPGSVTYAPEEIEECDVKRTTRP